MDTKVDSNVNVTVDTGLKPANVEPEKPFGTFVIVWLTQSLSTLGSTMTFFTLTLWLTLVKYPLPSQHGQLAAALSAVALALTVPGIVLAPVAGAWADRVDRKKTMLWMDFASGVVSLALAVLVVSQHLSFPLFIALLVLSGLFGEFHTASFGPSYAMMVPKARLARANGMMQTTNSLAKVFAPMLAATLTALDLPMFGKLGGTSAVLMIDAITFFISSTSLLFVSIPSPKQTAAREPSAERERGRIRSVGATLAAGATYIFERKALLWMLMTFTVGNFALQFFAVLEPLIVKYGVMGDAAKHGLAFSNAFALISALGSIGGVAGGLLVSIWGGLKSRRIYGVVVPAIFTGLAISGFGLSKTLMVCAVMSFLVLFTMPLTSTHSQAIWQSQTPHELQGRVFSFRVLISRLMMPIGTTLAGGLGTVLNPSLLVAIAGFVFAGFNVLQLLNPVLLHVEGDAKSVRGEDSVEFSG